MKKPLTVKILEFKRKLGTLGTFS